MTQIEVLMILKHWILIDTMSIYDATSASLEDKHSWLLVQLLAPCFYCYYPKKFYKLVLHATKQRAPWCSGWIDNTCQQWELQWFTSIETFEVALSHLSEPSSLFISIFIFPYVFKISLSKQYQVHVHFIPVPFVICIFRERGGKITREELIP